MSANPKPPQRPPQAGSERPARCKAHDQPVHDASNNCEWLSPGIHREHLKDPATQKSGS